MLILRAFSLNITSQNRANGVWQSFLIDLCFYQRKLLIQLQDFLNKPLYNQFSCLFSFPDTNTLFGGKRLNLG